MISIEKPPLDELAHFGVLGMHWGHRKARKDSATTGRSKKKKTESIELKAARDFVIKRKNELKEANKALNKQSAYGLLAPSKAKLKKVADARRELDYSKQDLGSAKILNHLNQKEKSKTQLALEDKYKKKGMSDNEAAVAAYKNIRTRKILMAIGAVGIGYAAYKMHDARVDKIIKSGTLLQHISSDSTSSVREAFYSSKNSLDRAKYTGLFARYVKSNNGEAFKKEIKVLSDIKQVSHKNAQKALSELMASDPEFAKAVKDYIRVDNNRINMGMTMKFHEAEKSLSKNIVNKSVYEVFNTALVDHSPDMQVLSDKYFKALSDKGYNAIRDIHDVKYSGFKAFNPIIAFNASGKINVVDVKKLADDEIKKASNIAYTHILGSGVLATGATWATAIMGVKSFSNSRIQSSNLRYVEQYRKKNPGTKLSSTEIIRNRERSRKNVY